jgi:hypothetical protein
MQKILLGQLDCQEGKTGNMSLSIIADRLAPNHPGRRGDLIIQTGKENNKFYNIVALQLFGRPELKTSFRNVLEIGDPIPVAIIDMTRGKRLRSRRPLRIRRLSKDSRSA